MNNEIKIFFVDLDGTLLDERKNGVKTISETNKKALAKARNQGIQIVISTGRIGKKARYWLSKTNLDYAVTGNGAQIIDRNFNVLRETKITQQQMAQVVAFVQEHSLALKIDETRIAYGVSSHLHKLIANDLHYAIKETYDEVPIEKALKLIIWGKAPQQLKPYAKIFMQKIPGISVVSAERGRTLEITSIEATKGKGNAFIMKLLNINPQNSAHIGDTMNDFSAIEYVGKFIAMGDAAPELLARAKYIGPNHHQHGVARVLAGEFSINPYQNDKNN